MTYLDKYPNCNDCPVEKYCGTVVGSIKLCHSYDDNMAAKESSHVLTLSKATPKTEREYAEEKMTVWDNKTD